MHALYMYQVTPHPGHLGTYRIKKSTGNSVTYQMSRKVFEGVGKYMVVSIGVGRFPNLNNQGTAGVCRIA